LVESLQYFIDEQVLALLLSQRVLVICIGHHALDAQLIAYSGDYLAIAQLHVFARPYGVWRTPPPHLRQNFDQRIRRFF
jgi:hypothetical protein